VGAYDPAVEIRTFDDAVVAAARLIEPGRRRLLGITGPPGAGKSTLAAGLVEALAPRAALVGMDAFHLANAELVRLGRRDRKGAPDTFDVGGYVALLRRLRAAAEPIVYAPLFDRSIEEPIGSAVPVGRDVPLIVTEGNYLLGNAEWAAVAPLLDECWYVDAAAEVRLQRLIARHAAYGKTAVDAQRWANGSDARNAAVVEATRDLATHVVRLP
jgi:pantothenate kinase